jgi:hypothetical protein
VRTKLASSAASAEPGDGIVTIFLRKVVLKQISQGVHVERRMCVRQSKHRIELNCFLKLRNCADRSLSRALALQVEAPK